MADFPQYRKYSHDRTYFKILSETSFEELNIMGTNYSINPFTAQTFVDRNLIADMIENRENNWEVIGNEEYNEKMEFCLQNLIRMTIE
jgi:hypothetical protein